ncbi:1-(5-phosphoribosyl)-5-[(5-phosphoribosylamino)methylideneamino]imidazole-4-carboxamide isomerase [Helicobacter sp. T3_23-1056]
MLEIFPAIDLKGGKAVRLYQGEFSSAKIYGEAADFLSEFEKSGAKWVHIVDLDGALSGREENLALIESLRKNTSLKIQVGGGIRDEKSIKKYINIGVNRVILGSIALKNVEFTKQVASIYPVVVGIDARGGKVAIEGWGSVSEIEASALAKQYADSAIEAIICTDISKDGALSGVNVDFTLAIAKASGKPTIASGGCKGIEDVIDLRRAFAKENLKGGLIIGKAFYEGKIDLKEALQRGVKKNS